LGLRDVVTFQAESVSEIETAFHDSVDDYLEFCKERGEAPERPYSGKFLLRLDPSLHRHIDAAAAVAGQSVNAWVVQVLEMASESAHAPSRAGSSQGGGVFAREGRRVRFSTKNTGSGNAEVVHTGSGTRELVGGSEFRESSTRRKPKTKASKK
jgi:predicted HicB family RNase H-like nuclease